MMNHVIQWCVKNDGGRVIKIANKKKEKRI